MKKSLIFLLILTITISCSEDPDFELALKIKQFKYKTSPQIEGEILGYNELFVFKDWGNDVGAYYKSFWCLTNDSTVQNRSYHIYKLNTGLVQGVRKIIVVSPAFYTTIPYEDKKSIFNVSEKPFNSIEGTIFNGFKIKVESQDISYSTHYSSTEYGNQKDSTFDVIKFEKVKMPRDPSDPDYNKVKLWILVNCNLYDSSGNQVGRIDNGKFIIEFLIGVNA